MKPLKMTKLRLARISIVSFVLLLKLGRDKKSCVQLFTIYGCYFEKVLFEDKKIFLNLVFQVAYARVFAKLSCYQRKSNIGS